MVTSYVCPYFWCDHGMVVWTARREKPAWVCASCGSVWSLNADPEKEIEAARADRDRLIEALRRPLDVETLRLFMDAPLDELVILARHSRTLARVGVLTPWEVIADLPPGQEVALSRWHDRVTAQGAVQRYRRAFRGGGAKRFWQAVQADGGGQHELAPKGETDGRW